MNKLRRGPGPTELKGNMRRYETKAEPKTLHVKGDSIPGNMMGYADSRSPVSFPTINDESKNYGPKRLPDPTGIDSSKTRPSDWKNYTAVNPSQSGWNQIQSQIKKGK